MRSATELARTLCQGWIDAFSAPELADAGIEAEVRQRLLQVGHELALIDGHWLALRGAPSEHHRGLVLRNNLGEFEQAVLCACYLHLVFLPSEHDQTVGAAGPSLPVDEIVAPFIERGHRKGEVEQALRRVCQAGWARRATGHLHAEPPLVAMGQHALHEMMYLTLMRRRIDRLAPGAERTD
jgi:hypothetical protein